MQDHEQMIDVSTLNNTQRVVLADVLLDNVSDDADPLTVEQKKLLMDRLAEARKAPEIYQSWEDAKRFILQKLQ